MILFHFSIVVQSHIYGSLYYIYTLTYCCIYNYYTCLTYHYYHLSGLNHYQETFHHT
jgi:hypothetical protein